MTVVVILASFFSALVLVLTSILLPKYLWVMPLMPVALAGLFLGMGKFIHYVVLLMVFLIPLNYFATIPGAGASVTMFKFLFPLAMVGLLLSYLSGQQRRITINALDVILIIWALYNIIPLMMAVDRVQALDTYRRLASMWLLYFVVSRLFTASTWQERMQQVVVVSMLISVLFGIQNYLTGTNPFAPREIPDFVRVSGVGYRSPNDYAIMIFLPLAWSFFLGIRSVGFKRVFYLACCPFFLIGIMLTYSRSAFVTFVLVALVGVFVLKEYLTPQRIMAILVLGVLVLPLLPSNYYARIKSLFTRPEGASEISLERRENYISVGLEIVKKHPLIGCGPGNFPVLHAMAEYQTELEWVGTPRLAHNMFLTVVTETGIIGLTIYLSLMSCALLHAWQLASPQNGEFNFGQALLISLISFLLMGLFLHLQMNKYLWLLLSMIRAGKEPQNEVAV